MTNRQASKLQKLINKAMIAIQEAQTEIEQIDMFAVNSWGGLDISDNHEAIGHRLNDALNHLHFAMGAVE